MPWGMEGMEFDMSQNAHDDTKGKKPYDRPQVKQVVLKPEEAVLGACKTTTVAGPAQPKCNNGGLRCSYIGS
jgi:hypothetical protein